MAVRNTLAIAFASSLFLNHDAAKGTGSESGVGTINPNGIYFNRFAGSFSGTEWFQTTPIAGTNRYQLVDIFGGGFDATITPEGLITLDNGIGGGSFSDNNNYVITPDLGSIFTFTCNRAPLTDANFPLQLVSARPASDLFTGTWNNVIESINPETGSIGSPSNEDLILTVSGNTLRITDPGGLYFQGVFETGRQIVFRKIDPNPAGSSVASFPGSDINFSQDMVASVYFDHINKFSGLFMLQSRTALGSQTQLMFRFTAIRATPLAAGDINGDGMVDETDRNLLIGQQGSTVEDDGYSLAADLNLDDRIDEMDLIIYDGDVFLFASSFE